MNDKSTHFKSSALIISTIIIIIFIIAKLVISVFSVSVSDNSTLQQRIAPIGAVYLEGELENIKLVKTTVIVKQNNRGGKEIYQSICATCHNTGVAGAPKFGDNNAWSARIKKGLAALVKSATIGINAMPPKGTCVDCSTAELTAAIKYLTKLK